MMWPGGTSGVGCENMFLKKLKMKMKEYLVTKYDAVVLWSRK